MLYLSWIIIFIWILWSMGYPIYRKVNKRSVFDGDSLYAIGLSFIALVLNIVLFIAKLVR